MKYSLQLEMCVTRFSWLFKYPPSLCGSYFSCFLLYSHYYQPNPSPSSSLTEMENVSLICYLLSLFVVEHFSRLLTRDWPVNLENEIPIFGIKRGNFRGNKYHEYFFFLLQSINFTNRHHFTHSISGWRGWEAMFGKKMIKFIDLSTY